MGRREQIVEQLAREQVVERMCLATAHATTLSADLSDLAQLVYLILLTYDEEKIVDLAETGALRFFIARVIVNQYCSTMSPYHLTIRRFRSLTNELNPDDYDEKNPTDNPRR